MTSKTHPKPLVRTYTISRHDAENQELDVDFVIHSSSDISNDSVSDSSKAGPASAWAMAAKSGDELYISGPGSKKLANLDAPWFFLVGDMTALPAISIVLKELPDNAQGYLVLEVMSDADKQNLVVPENMQVHWVTRSKREPDDLAYTDKVKNLPFLEGTPYVWVACEFTDMRCLRQYFKKECNIGKESIYISSYWKKGISEDHHKIEKRKDLEGGSSVLGVMKTVLQKIK